MQIMGNKLLQQTWPLQEEDYLGCIVLLIQEEKGFGLQKPGLFCIMKHFASSKILPKYILLPRQMFYAFCEVNTGQNMWSLF